MNIGIVGHGADKFDERSKATAISRIIEILETYPGCTVVSGHSPVGGIDIWAEETAKQLGHDTLIFEPDYKMWDPAGKYGYKARNIDIARHSDIVYCIVVRQLPRGYRGMTFPSCYHCDKHPGKSHGTHVKSGGCWTAWVAIRHGNQARWVVIP